MSMEAAKRKHEVEPESDDSETATLWYFNPSTLKNQSIDINKNEFLIGRAKEVDFQVTAQRVSRAHCLIRNVGTRNAPKWELVDKNSTLGTFLNSRKVPANQPAPLKDGDVIYLSDPDVYPIRFVTNGSKPAKVAKPDPIFPVDNDVIVIQDYKSNNEIGGKIEKTVIDLTDSDHTDIQIRNKPSIAVSEDTLSAKSSEKIINNNSTKPKFISNNIIADKENNLNEENKLKLSELSKLNQKLQDQEQEMERLRAELKQKDEEMDRLSKDKAILKYIEETNIVMIKDLQEDLSAKKRELETYQELHSEEALTLRTSKTFVELVEAELQCSICNEVIVTASIIVPCFHVFCNACIGMWFRQKKECAVCRTPSQLRLPCKILDSLIDKLMEIIPDQEYKQKRRQICEERKAQELNLPVAGVPPQAHQARQVLDPYLAGFGPGQMLMEVTIGAGGPGRRLVIGNPNNPPQHDGMTIDLTVHDIAAANAAAAAAGAHARVPRATVGRPRTRRVHRNT